MPATLKTREEEFITKGNRPLYRILEDLQLSQQAYLVVRDGVLLTGDDRILEGDVVELISVVSGG
ncbi:MAG: MoaD/ThiS family protein [Anaerolineaceae bacterium]